MLKIVDGIVADGTGVFVSVGVMADAQDMGEVG